MAGRARVLQEAARSFKERWERLALPAAIVGTWLLAVAIDVRPGACPCHLGIGWEWRAALVALIGALWLLEFRGVRAPRPLFAAAIVLPAALLNVAKAGALSMLFALLTVAWVSDRGSRRESLWVLAIVLAGMVSYLPDRDVEGQFSLAAGAVCVWLMMRGLRTQRRLVDELRAAQDALAAQAAQAERRRIAGEIHDVAAHSLAVTMLHLTGTRLLLQRLGADRRAVEALAEAERSGRQSLDDLRRTVGLLDDGSPGRPDGRAAPLPTAADIPVLVDEFRVAGMDVTLAVGGDPARLPAAVGLALYRIAHEALANTVKHAPGGVVRVALEVDREGGVARLTVHDSGAAPGRPGNKRSESMGSVAPARSDAPAGSGPSATADAGTGHGIATLRERAALLGGHLSAGPDGAGWLVECVLPYATSSLPAPVAGVAGVAGLAPG